MMTIESVALEAPAAADALLIMSAMSADRATDDRLGGVAAQTFGAERIEVLHPSVLSSAARPTRPVFVLIEHAAWTLARRLAHGAEPSAALDAWVREAEAFLALQRSERRRLTLLDPRVFIEPSRETIDVLSRRAGRPLSLQPIAEAALSAPHGLDVLAAAGLLESSPAARALWAELEAATVGAHRDVVGRNTLEAVAVDAVRLRREAAVLAAERDALAGRVAEAASAANLAAAREAHLKAQIDRLEETAAMTDRLRAEIAHVEHVRLSAEREHQSAMSELHLRIEALVVEARSANAALEASHADYTAREQLVRVEADRLSAALRGSEVARATAEQALADHVAALETARQEASRREASAREEAARLEATLAESSAAWEAERASYLERIAAFEAAAVEAARQEDAASTVQLEAALNDSQATKARLAAIEAQLARSTHREETLKSQVQIEFQRRNILDRENKEKINNMTAHIERLAASQAAAVQRADELQFTASKLAEQLLWEDDRRVLESRIQEERKPGLGQKMSKLTEVSSRKIVDPLRAAAKQLKN